MTRISDKISEINKFLEELAGIAPSTLEEYMSSIEKKAACERYVEKIVEAITDLAFLLIKHKKLRIPQDDADAFSILLENSIMSSELAEKLKDAKGMRNVISHQYGMVDDEIVFEAITKGLVQNAREFIGAVS